MLKSLSIGNFKAFGATQTIPIRPITLVFGANSSGKSSIIHSLLLANQAIETGNWDVHEPQLGGGCVDLGGFAHYCHGRDVSGVCVLGYGFSAAGSEFRVTLSVGELAGDGSGGTECATATIREVELAIAGKPALTFVPHGRDTFRCSAIYTQNPVVQNMVLWALDQVENESGSQNMKAAEAVIAALLHDLQSDRQGLADNGLGKSSGPGAGWIKAIIKRETERAHAESPEAVRRLVKWLAFGRELDAQDVQKQLEGVATQQTFRLFSSKIDEIRGDEQWDSPEKKWMVDTMPLSYLRDCDDSEWNTADRKRKDQVLLAGYELRPYIKAAFGSLNSVLRSVCYLGPLRAIPKRHGVQWDDTRVQAGGGLDAWARIVSQRTAQEIVNRWLGPGFLGTPYRLTTRRLVYDDEPSKGVGPPDLQFEVGSSRLRLSHRDLGFGITQVLPILVSAASPSKGIVAIEQPELHLHPAMQAELGDVFIESALGERKNTFLIETHSEHLILRIMRRIRETHLGKLPKDKHLPPIRPSDVAVLYVELDGPHSLVREFPLNEWGELVKAWPGGFFEEDLREVFG